MLSNYFIRRIGRGNSRYQTPYRLPGVTVHEMIGFIGTTRMSPFKASAVSSFTSMVVPGVRESVAEEGMLISKRKSMRSKSQRLNE